MPSSWIRSQYTLWVVDKKKTFGFLTTINELKMVGLSFGIGIRAEGPEIYFNISEKYFIRILRIEW